MAYKQKGCTPITAKIQKTTKGGVTNPLLKAMGVPMKKNPSMAKRSDLPTSTKTSNRDAENDATMGRIKDKYQRVVNAKNRREGKAVSYDAAYADADKSKYKTKEEFITAAKSYNKKKYNTTNPTADAKKAGKTKAQLATDVKNNRSKSRPKVEKVSNIETRGTTEKTPEIKITPKVAKTKKEVRVENRTNRQTARKENRANRKATREENRANRKAARKGSPAKQTNLKKGNKRVKQKMGEAVILPVKEKAVNTTKAPAGYSSRTRKDMAAKKAVTPTKQTMQQQNRKEKREARLEARRVVPKKGNAKMAKKAKVYGK